MTILSKRITGLLFAAALPFFVVKQAQAASGAATSAKIEKLEHEIAQLAAEVKDLKRSTSSQYADVKDQQQVQQKTVTELTQTVPQAQPKPNDVKTTLDNGRPTFASADGRFTAAVRALGQFDTGYFMQGGNARNLPIANGPDLSSGSNFRRAQLGVQGKIFGDWSYYFNYDFGSGSSKGDEQQGRIQSLFVEYDGLAPFAFRIGAYPPPAGLEDGTSSGDTIFLERNSPSDVARNIAGGDGRDAASILYTGERIFGALSYTGDKAADTMLYFDEQNALLGRLSGVVYQDADARLVLSGNGTYVFRVGDATQSAASTRNISFTDPPELTFDDNSGSGGTQLISTGNINAGRVKEWGLEAGGNWRNFYAQSGYFGYAVERRQSALSNPDFHGWYAQASWVLTGEAKGYSTASGAFTAPKPALPFALDGSSWGAWEVAARYSDLDLNYDAGSAGSAAPADGIRGGEQKIWTLGLNWYPNTVIRFALDYEWIDIDRLSATKTVSGIPGNYPQLGQKIQAVALRSQISF